VDAGVEMFYEATLSSSTTICNFIWDRQETVPQFWYYSLQVLLTWYSNKQNISICNKYLRHSNKQLKNVGR